MGFLFDSSGLWYRIGRLILNEIYVAREKYIYSLEMWGL